MTEKKKTDKKIIIAAAVLVILAVLFGALYAGFHAKGAAGSKEIQVTVVHKDLSEKEFTIKTDAAWLGEALTDEDLIAGQEGDYGLYVTEVDKETADEANQEWWCITKDKETLMTGVDAT
ncbi:MAG TPA: hypothetical protein PLU43_08670, partial [Lachnospiraceae bacterium]|nr:hypothetical protein [Lachnospiraceae bacterium]